MSYNFTEWVQSSMGHGPELGRKWVCHTGVPCGGSKWCRARSVGPSPVETRDHTHGGRPTSEGPGSCTHRTTVSSGYSRSPCLLLPRFYISMFQEVGSGSRPTALGPKVSCHVLSLLRPTPRPKAPVGTLPRQIYVTQIDEKPPLSTYLTLP